MPQLTGLKAKGCHNSDTKIKHYIHIRLQTQTKIFIAMTLFKKNTTSTGNLMFSREKGLHTEKATK